MSAPRQQRQSFNRRLTTPNSPALLPSLVPQLLTYTGAVATFTFSVLDVPPVSLSTPLPIVLQGLPQVRRIPQNDYPIAAALNGDSTQLVLTYAGPISGDPDSFWFGPNDPALRTATGGYVAPSVPGPVSIAPVEQPWAIQVLGLSMATVTVPVGNPVDWYAAPDKWYNVTANLYADEVRWVGITLELTFSGGAMSPGDVFRYEGVAIRGATVAVHVPAPGDVVST